MPERLEHARRLAQKSKEARDMLCASCSETTSSDPCTACDKPALLDERFRLDEVIGRGAMGTTYRATRLEDDLTVAVKEVAFRHAKDVKDWELGRREAEVLKQLSHGQIPKYHDHFLFGQGKNTALFIVQELIKGQSLAKELENKRYTEDEVLKVLEELLPVLEHLHGLSPPIIHRDLKPSNVMRRERDGTLMLIDFGTVRDAMKDAKIGGSTIVGTFGYMAPEQYEGHATPATDLYGLGALALTLLSREDPSTMMRYGAKLEWEDRVSVSVHFADLLRDLLDPNPNNRPESATEVLERVRAIRSGDVESVRAQPAVVHKKKVSGTKMAMFGIVMGLALVGGVVGRFSNRSEPSSSSSSSSSHARPYQAYRDNGDPKDIEAWCDVKNFPRACYRWGTILEKGGFPEHAAEAYQKSCNRLNGAGCNALGEMYQEGRGVPQSSERAHGFFKSACAGGHTPACTR